MHPGQQVGLGTNGSKMSARLENELGTKPEVSFEGARAANWAATKITFLMAL